MATVNPATTPQRSAKVIGQRLLVDTAQMSVRKVTKSESSILSALEYLAPVEKATLSTVMDALRANKRKRAPAQSATGEGHG